MAESNPQQYKPFLRLIGSRREPQTMHILGLLDEYGLKDGRDYVFEESTRRGVFAETHIGRTLKNVCDDQILVVSDSADIGSAGLIGGVILINDYLKANGRTLKQIARERNG